MYANLKFRNLLRLKGVEEQIMLLSLDFFVLFYYFFCN